MKIIESYVSIDDIEIYKEKILKNLEKIGRVCYKSESKVTENSYENFIKMIIDKEHYSILEHETVSVLVVCDRGVSHEIVRHRIASYAQESTRYCNYAKDKFNNQITIINPVGMKLPTFIDFDYAYLDLYFEQGKIDKFKYDYMKTLLDIEGIYMRGIEEGFSPQIMRSILPNSLKTEIWMTMNLREWMHFFKLRTSEKAHTDMQRVAKKIQACFINMLPEIFDCGRGI